MEAPTGGSGTMEPMNTHPTLRLIACPSLISVHDRIDRFVLPGMTVAEHLREIGWKPNTLNARVTIDDRVIEYAEWEYAVPQAGQAFVTRVIPMNGGGKDLFRIVAMVGMLALAFAAPALIGAYGGLAGALLATTPGAAGIITAVTSIAGTLLLSALIPPSRPRLNDLTSNNLSPTLSLTGSANQFAPYAPIPRVYGKHRVYPPLASRTFTEISGPDQYLRLLFCFGYGPLDLEDFRIGKTALDQFEDVEMEVRYGYADDLPMKLFPKDVYEDSLSILLSSTFVTRNSQDDAKELSVDVTFPSGVGQFHAEQGFQPHRVDIWVEYRKVGDVTWTPIIDVAKAAAFTTNFPGANNDLVFTARQAGAVGNSIVVRLIPSINIHVPLSTHVQVFTTGIPPTIRSTPRIDIYFRPGIATAAQVKAVFEANALANSAVAVTFKLGNTGAGTIPQRVPVYPDRQTIWGSQLAGGANVVPTFTASGPTQKQLRLSRRFPVDVDNPAQYEVRVRTTHDPETDPIIQLYLSTVYWTVLRTFQATPPTTQAGLCKVAMRIKATGQLNGTVEEFNAIATSILPDWDPDLQQWTDQPTSNPASIYRDVLQGTANRRPKTDAQLDMAQIQAFHEKNTAEGFKFNAVIDFRTTVKQLRQDVLAAGRATFHLRDMLYSVLFETIQPVGVAGITPRNSSGFTWHKRFLEIPHALRIRYVDEDSDYKQNERIVYADGFDKTTASIFEDGEAGLGVTSSTQVFKLKKRELAEAVLRADDYSIKMDFEHLQFSRGDRVDLQHDTVLFALNSARILEGQVDGANLILELLLDEPVTMELGKDYGVRIWKGTGGSCVGKADTVEGIQTTLTFSTPIPDSVGVNVGDLISFGLFGQEAVPCIVKSIRPGQDYSATVSLIDYAPAIMTADVVPIPDYEGNVTNPQEDRRRVPIPIIDRVQSDEAVLVRGLDGSFQSRILVTVTLQSGYRIPPDRLEAQFRESTSEAPWTQLGVAVNSTAAEISLVPVTDRVLYDFRLRGVDSRTGSVSDWNWVQGYQVIGKATPPPDVELLVLEKDRMRWNYADPPRDLAGFRVRYRPGTDRRWDGAIPAHDGVLLTTDFTIFRNVGPTTFMVKAVDVADHESVNAAFLTATFGDLLIENIVLDTDHRALGWPGTKTNALIVASQLIADTSVPFWTDDDALFWSGFDASLFWTASFLEMTYEFQVTPPVEFLDATLKLALTATGDWMIQYRSDSSASMWSADDTIKMWGTGTDPMWSVRGPFTQWPGELAPLSRQRYDIRITTKGGLIEGILDQLRVIMDVPDLFEYLNNQVIVAGGTRLPLTKTFRAIKAVQVDLLDDGGDATRLKVMDKDLTLHPLVKAFNSADVTTGALIDAAVQGY